MPPKGRVKIKYWNTTLDDIKKIQSKKASGVEQDGVFSPKVPVQQFDLSVNEDIKDRIILDNIKTAQFLRINFFDEKQMAEVGLPVVSKADAGRLFGVGVPVPNVREVEDAYNKGDNAGRMDMDRLTMSEKDVIKKYTAMYQEDFYKSVEALVQLPLGALSNVSTDPNTPTDLEATVTSFLPDRKFAIRQNYINSVRRANPGITEEDAINALLNDPEIGYIFKLL